jgi:glutathione S-transferase
MSGTSLDKPSKALDTLDGLLAKTDWIVDNEFSVADVAIASYLNYVPVFFQVKQVPRPNIVRYMRRYPLAMENVFTYVTHITMEMKCKLA